MTRTLATVTVALAVALTGCRGEGQPPEPPAADVMPAIAAQPDRPLLARGAVGLTERLRLAPGGRWSDARDVAVDGDGNLYVLDEVVPARILKFDPAGRYVLRMGEGEPEPTVLLVQKISMAPDWNTLLMVDRASSTVATFLTLGPRSYKVLVTGGAPINVLGLPAFGEYYLQGWDQARNRSGVYHVRLPLDTLATTYEVAVPTNEPIGRVARSVYFRTAVDRQGRLYVGFYDDYPVRVLEPSGRTRALIGIDREPVLRSAEALAAETAENLAKLRKEAPDEPDSLLREAARPDSALPIVDELAVDPQGRLWVRTHRADADGTTPYDVFEPKGHYLARVDVPGDVRATAFTADGRLVVLDGSRDPAGVVVEYEVSY